MGLLVGSVGVPERRGGSPCALTRAGARHRKRPESAGDARLLDPEHVQTLADLYHAMTVIEPRLRRLERMFQVYGRLGHYLPDELWLLLRRCVGPMARRRELRSACCWRLAVGHVGDVLGGAELSCHHLPVAAQEEGQKKGACKGGQTAGRERPLASGKTLPKGKRDESKRVLAKDRHPGRCSVVTIQESEKRHPE